MSELTEPLANALSLLEQFPAYAEPFINAPSDLHKLHPAYARIAGSHEELQHQKQYLMDLAEEFTVSDYEELASSWGKLCTAIAAASPTLKGVVARLSAFQPRTVAGSSTTTSIKKWRAAIKSLQLYVRRQEGDNGLLAQLEKNCPSQKDEILKAAEEAWNVIGEVLELWDGLFHVS